MCFSLSSASHQIPLGCVCFRYLHLAYATPTVQAYTQQLSLPALLLRGGAVFVALVLLKIVIGVGLVFYAAGAHKRDAAVFLRTPAMAKNNENKISSGSGTGTFHNTVNVAPSGAGPLLGAPLSRQNSLLHDPCEEHPKMSLSAVGIAGIAVSPCEVARPDVYDTPSHHAQYNPAFTPHTPQCPSNMHTPVQQTRPHSHSITNPFTEIHVSTEEVRRVVAAVGVDGAEEFIESQVENQQLYVGDGVHIVPLEPSQAEPEAPAEDAATDGEGPLRIHTSPTARSAAAQSGQQSQTAPRTRPPLGRLNLGAGSGSNYSSAEHATDLFEHIVSPPMSPLNRSAAGSIVGGDGGNHSMHTPGPSTATTTSTPIVQLDAHAFNQHKLNTAPFVSRPHQNSIHGHPRDDGEHSDNEDTRSNMSDVSRNTTLEEAEAQRMKERLEFMEELSSIERYTVYKGRIL